MTEISADEAGNAEQVLRRLVSERKALEAGYEVLRTYREVKSELQPAAQRLQELREQVNAVNNELNGLISEKERRLREIDESAALHRTRTLNAVQVDIDAARSVLTEVQHDIARQQAALDELVQRHAATMDMHSVELANVQQELLEARRQHSAIVEAVSRAATAFTTRST